jgi:hypothetical protein
MGAGGGVAIVGGADVAATGGASAGGGAVVTAGGAALTDTAGIGVPIGTHGMTPLAAGMLYGTKPGGHVDGTAEAVGVGATRAGSSKNSKYADATRQNGARTIKMRFGIESSLYFVTHAASEGRGSGEGDP